MKAKKIKRVEVVWEDSTEYWDERGKDIQLDRLAEAVGLAEIHSIGYLLHEDKRRVVIGWSMDEKSVDRTLAIPKGCIVKRRFLK